MSKEYMIYVLIITPIFFYTLTKLTLQRYIFYIKKYSILSRFSFYRYLKKNNIGLVAYLEINNLQNVLKTYTDKKEHIINGKIISVLKKYSEEYKFELFYFSDDKYILVNEDVNINYHQVFETLINDLNESIKKKIK